MGGRVLLFACALAAFAGLWRLRALTEIPATPQGDLKTALVDADGQVNPRLNEAIGSVADALARERGAPPADPLAGLDPERRRELPKELVDALSRGTEDPQSTIRVYFSSLGERDFDAQAQVLALLRATGETWRPLLEETSLRILERPNDANFVSDSELTALRQAAEVFTEARESVRRELWEQVRALHPQAKAREVIAEALRIEATGTQSAGEDLH